MNKLFSSFKIRDLTFKNRILIPPMCMYSATDGVPNNFHLVHLGSRALGGVAGIIVEATGVTPEGRISLGCLGLWNEEQMKAFKPITEFVKAQNCHIGIQLAHAGRKASSHLSWNGGGALTLDQGGWETIGPSALAFSDQCLVPREMTTQDIQETVVAFKEAAKRALLAGFSFIELHAAHGYLMHEFLSPISNKRTDEYGGSLENRMRFALQVAQEVRSVLPEGMPLFMRISATDWAPDGWDLEQCIPFVKELKKIGVDLIDVSSGGNASHQKIPVEALYQVPFAEAIRKNANIPTAAVGLITEASEAEKIILDEKADFVLLGRAMLKNPHWALHAAQELDAKVQWPLQYERGKK